jgi:class 3 adenylate cyclase
VPSRPSGTVAFLFSDVVGSTRLWELDRKGMAASLASHDRIVDGCIGDLDGYVFSTAGDSSLPPSPHPPLPLPLR